METQEHYEAFDRPPEQFAGMLDALPASELLQLRNVLAKTAMTQEDLALIRSYCETSGYDIKMARLQYRNCLLDEIGLLWQRKAPMLRYLLPCKETDERD